MEEYPPGPLQNESAREHIRPIKRAAPRGIARRDEASSIPAMPPPAALNKSCRDIILLARSKKTRGLQLIICRCTTAFLWWSANSRVPSPLLHRGNTVCGALGYSNGPSRERHALPRPRPSIDGRAILFATLPRLAFEVRTPRCACHTTRPSDPNADYQSPNNPFFHCRR